MKKEFEEFVMRRCGVALSENQEYLKLEQSEDATQDQLQAKAEEVCYKKALKDFADLMKCSQIM